MKPEQWERTVRNVQISLTPEQVTVTRIPVFKDPEFEQTDESLAGEVQTTLGLLQGPPTEEQIVHIVGIIRRLEDDRAILAETRVKLADAEAEKLRLQGVEKLLLGSVCRTIAELDRLDRSRAPLMVRKSAIKELRRVGKIPSTRSEKRAS
ncbi:MAG: hypothetical protein EXS49_00110 [Candidatus Pacebacteria bacterium]|nr:hypothetical protein [Candidatus Paceibacterota bacterium]